MESDATDSKFTSGGDKVIMIEAICFDLGDTLIAEETVIHNSVGQALTTDIIESTFKILDKIRKSGCKLTLIANANSVSARNIVKTTSLENYFNVIVISEELGVEKPDQQIFVAALAKLGVKPRNTVMVGNRIDSDIIEANRVGMKSVLFKWNTRYDELITSEEEKPKFIIGSLTELPGLLGLM